ncbi:hypothetical protein QZH41_005664 [Actinostola sp. cb2023]|nr:hypothetical protein QZH41_005664 [Actinostola sp. cb2023]
MASNFTYLVLGWRSTPGSTCAWILGRRSTPGGTRLWIWASAVPPVAPALGFGLAQYPQGHPPLDLVWQSTPGGTCAWIADGAVPLGTPALGFGLVQYPPRGTCAWILGWRSTLMGNRTWFCDGAVPPGAPAHGFGLAQYPRGHMSLDLGWRTGAPAHGFWAGAVPPPLDLGWRSTPRGIRPWIWAGRVPPGAAAHGLQMAQYPWAHPPLDLGWCSTPGGTCAWILGWRIDVFHHQHPQERHRVYAIIDDQSNTSMITPDLADKLKADGPRDRYLLSTWSGEKEVNYGRRISGVLLSAGNKTSKLPTLVECAHIPQDKAEIPTPEIAGRFSHLRDIAQDIPPLDDQAKIHLLIGRDAPELLKVRAFKNGPRGAPWAQKLVLGCTISGQACLDFANGPVHIQARRTVMGDNDSYARTDTLAEMPPGVTDSNEYDIVPCPNKFLVTDSLVDRYTNDLPLLAKRQRNQPVLRRPEVPEGNGGRHT